MLNNQPSPHELKPSILNSCLIALNALKRLFCIHIPFIAKALCVNIAKGVFE